MKINPSDYKNWNDYYWHYQHLLAKQYLIPMLDEGGVRLKESKVLEIGCGNGGVIETLAEEASKAVGIDLKDFDRSEHASGKVHYITADIFDASKRYLYADQYNLIVLRDVIEHLPDKESIFHLFGELLGVNGHIFITFPPYYSPFGAHQQVFSKTVAGKLPYLHWLPEKIYLKWVSVAEKNNQNAYDLAIEMEKAKTTIGQINRFIRKFGYSLSNQRYYFIRPSYDIRYGFKPRKCTWLKYVPLIREILVLGVYMVLKKEPHENH